MGSILIVDDEPGIRQMLGLTLAGDGYRYTEAANADEASAEVKRELPDLILLDWMLPGISGVDFAATLKTGRQNARYSDHYADGKRGRER